MALNITISKEDFEKLSADVKKEYKEDGEEYKLDLIDYEDPGALKRAKEHEKKKRKETEEKLTEANSKIEELEENAASGNKDVEKLKSDLEKKYKKENEEAKQKAERLERSVKESMINSTAKELAGEIATVTPLMEQYIKGRLTVETDGDEYSLKIMGGDGKPSDLDLAGLKKEIVDNKEFAPILKASKASGSGNGSANPNKPSVTPPASNEPVNYASMSPVDLAAHLKAQKEADTNT